MSICQKCEKEIKGIVYYYCEECRTGALPSCWDEDHYIVPLCLDCLKDIEEEGI